VADRNTLREDYRLALVKEVFPGEDGRVRRVAIQYESYRTGERAHEDTVVSRAVTSCPACSAGVKPVTEVNKCKECDNEQFAELIFSVWFSSPLVLSVVYQIHRKKIISTLFNLRLHNCSLCRGCLSRFLQSFFKFRLEATISLHSGLTALSNFVPDIAVRSRNTSSP
ncbi:unnamed protein product, partial [Porites lobata]